jgi:CelD/BcsL family acetyltransferase involved in cellulose biosynthesis
MCEGCPHGLHSVNAGVHRIELVTELGRLLAIEPALQQLYARAAGATPFQSPDWLLPWAEAFPGGGAQRSLVLWQRDRALAWLPLVLASRAGESTLAWLGEGLSDYLDIVADPAAASAALSDLWEALRSEARAVDRVDLNDVPAQSPLRTELESLPIARCEIAAFCPVLSPGPDRGAYLRGLPPWLQRNVTRSLGRLARQGELSWRRMASGEHALLDVFFELHSARWAAQGEPGVLAHPSVRAFHRQAAPRLIARGLLELDVLFCAGRPVAASYALVRSGAHLYLNGFDPSVAGVSLGSLVIEHAIGSAIEQRRERVDLLRGQEPYKYAWGARDTNTYRLLGPRPDEHAAAARSGGTAQPQQLLPDQ